MAITVGTVATGATDDDTTTVSVTVASTPAPLLLCFIGLGATSASSQIDTVIYNGTEAFTYLGYVDDGTDGAMEVWYLNAPSTGTHNVVVDYAGSTTPDAGVAVIPIYGVLASDPIGAVNTGTGTSSNPSIVVATEADNSWVFDGWEAEDDEVPTYTGGANQTELFDFLGGIGAGDFSMGGGYKETTSHGNITMSQTFSSGSEIYAGIAVEVKVGEGENVDVGVSALTTNSPATTINYGYNFSVGVSALQIASPDSSANSTSVIDVGISALQIVSPTATAFTQTNVNVGISALQIASPSSSAGQVINIRDETSSLSIRGGRSTVFMSRSRSEVFDLLSQHSASWSGGARNTIWTIAESGGDWSEPEVKNTNWS
jgi:hypothetical protein